MVPPSRSAVSSAWGGRVRPLPAVCRASVRSEACAQHTSVHCLQHICSNLGFHPPITGRVRPVFRFSDLVRITTRRLVAVRPIRPGFLRPQHGCLPSSTRCLPAICLLAYRDSVYDFLPGSRHAPRIRYDPAAPPAALARPATAVQRRANVVAASPFHAEMAFQHTFAVTVGLPARRAPSPGHPATPYRTAFQTRRLRAIPVTARKRRAATNSTAARPFRAEMASHRTFTAAVGPHDPREPPPGHWAAPFRAPRRSRRLRRPTVAYSSNVASLLSDLHQWSCSGHMSC